MTSNKGTKKKVKKSPSNNRRLKNTKEKSIDAKEWQDSLNKLFRATHQFYEEFGNCESDYGYIGVKHYDAMKSANEKACWAKTTMGKKYVAKSLQGNFGTTSYEGLYKADPA